MAAGFLSCRKWQAHESRRASGGFDGGVVFMGSVDRRGAAPLFALESHRVTCLAWSPDGRLLAGGSDGGPAFFLRLA